MKSEADKEDGSEIKDEDEGDVTTPPQTMNEDADDETQTQTKNGEGSNDDYCVSTGQLLCTCLLIAFPFAQHT